MPEDTPRQWVTAALYAGVIAGNLYVLWDWWSGTARGTEMRAQVRSRFEVLRTKLRECDGCARRKARLQELWEAKVDAAAESAVMEATSIVEGR